MKAPVAAPLLLPLLAASLRTDRRGVVCLSVVTEYMKSREEVCGSAPANLVSDCKDVLYRARGKFFDCLNGNDGQPGDQGPCWEYAQMALASDPQVKASSTSIVLWSGLKPEEQQRFIPLQNASAEKPLLLGNTWASSITEKVQTYDWKDDERCSPITDASPNRCTNGCGWDKASTLRPWEAMSRWLAERSSSAGIAEGGSTAYLLLKHFASTNVFARVELPTVTRLMLMEAGKVIDVARQGMSPSEATRAIAGRVQGTVNVMSIRIAAGAVDKSDMFLSSDGSTTAIARMNKDYPPLTCGAVIQFVEAITALQKAKMPEGGNPYLCVKCYEKCDTATGFGLAEEQGTCENIMNHHCARSQFKDAANRIIAANELKKASKGVVSMIRRLIRRRARMS